MRFAPSLRHRLHAAIVFSDVSTAFPYTVGGLCFELQVMLDHAFAKENSVFVACQAVVCFSFHCHYLCCLHSAISLCRTLHGSCTCCSMPCIRFCVIKLAVYWQCLTLLYLCRLQLWMRPSSSTLCLVWEPMLPSSFLVGLSSTSHRYDTLMCRYHGHTTNCNLV